MQAQRIVVALAVTGLLLTGAATATAKQTKPLLTMKAARTAAHDYLVDQLRKGNDKGFRIGPGIRIARDRILFIPVERCALKSPAKRQTTTGPMYIAPGQSPCRDIQYPMPISRDDNGVFIDWNWYFIDP